jgi:sugar lactone lactonase YvrE
MPSGLSRTRITAVHPTWAVEGGRVTVEGSDFALDSPSLPEVRVGERVARVVHASPNALSILVPPGLDGGRTAVRVEGAPGETVFIELGVPIATGLHQVDNPVFDLDGNLYVTYSGSRGQQAPVSIFRVRRDGVREPFVSGITNPTSMAFDERGRLYVSSRFEGTVYRIRADGSFEVVASDLGVACGLAFDAGGSLYVGDRSGTIFRVSATGDTTAFATLASSVAAFHLTVGPDTGLYVTAPTLASYDAVYRIDQTGKVSIVSSNFGRPQGLVFDAQGVLYVVEALAGASGLYRVRDDGTAEQVLAAPGLVGVAVDPAGGMAVASNDTAYRLNVNVQAG